MWQYAVLPDGKEYGAQSASIDHDIGKRSFIYQDPPEPPTEQEYEIVKCRWLYGREKLSALGNAGEAIVAIKAGQIVQGVDPPEHDGKWVKVRWSGEVWMHGYYLEEM